jgi:hypothetical protein
MGRARRWCAGPVSLVSAEPVAIGRRAGEDGGVTLPSVIAHPLVGLLAVIGFLALVYRLVRAAARLGLSTLESVSLGGMAEISIRNGDLTGMAERQAQSRIARRARVRAILLFFFWIALLIAPAVAGISRPVYALAALLWLLPRRRIRLDTAKGVRRV